MVAAVTASVSIAYAPIYARYVGDDFGDWAHSSTLEDVATSSPWSLLLVPVGTLLPVASLHFVNAVAAVCARWATASLGRVRVAASRAGRTR